MAAATTETPADLGAQNVATQDTPLSPTTEPTPVVPTNGNAAGSKPEVAAPYPLRNKALQVATLPAHPLLDNAASAPSLTSYLHGLLAPAYKLIDQTFPSQWTSDGTKNSKPASGKVKLYRWEDNRADQTWFIRRSTHANVGNVGTFTWEELDDALRVEHSVKEAEYTPDIYAHVEIARWGPAEGLEPGMTVDDFTEIDMRLVEMAHNLPKPLIPRVFAQIVVSAKTPDNGLIVVQAPIDLRKCDAAFYSNDRNTAKGATLQEKKRTLIGEYISIERAYTTETGVIEWTMGTVSDAKGALPAWIQRSQIGNAIAKDVGFVTQWLMKKRQTHSTGANVTLRQA